MKIEDVQVKTFWKGEVGVTGTVENAFGRWYVRLEIKGSEIYSCSCSCGNGNDYSSPCVHEKALLQHYLTHREETLERPVSTARQVRDMIREYTSREIAAAAGGDPALRVELVPRLLIQHQDIRVEFRVSRGRSYVVRDLVEFIGAAERGAYVEYGKSLAFYHARDAFTEDSRKLWDLAAEAVDAYREHYREFRKNVYSPVPPLRELNLGRLLRDRFFAVLAGREIEAEDARGMRRLFVQAENPDVCVWVRPAGPRGIRVLLDRDLITFSGEKHLYIIKGNSLYICDEAFTRRMKVFFEQMTQGYGAPYEADVNEKDIPLFYERVLKKAESLGILGLDGVDLEKYRPAELAARFVLDSPQPGRVVLHPELRYGDVSFHPMDDSHLPPSVCRDVPGEYRISQVLKKYFRYREPETDDLVIADDEDAVFRLLDEGIGELKRLGEVYLGESMKGLKVLPPGNVTVGIRASENWLTLTVDAGDLNGEDLNGILSAYREKRSYYRLKTGEFLRLEDNGLLSVARMADGLNVPKGDMAKASFRVPAYRALYLDSLYRDQNDVRLERNERFLAIVRGMRSAADSCFEIPDPFGEVLREYQKAGFRWLKTLDFYGFGGILADDMGLGKTVQVISVIYDEARRARREAESGASSGSGADSSGEAVSGGAPDGDDHGGPGEVRKTCASGPARPVSLIVCPASLIYNWECEFRKFAPSLKTLLVMGGAAERAEKLRHMADYDVVITSYDLLRRDVEKYKGMVFRFQVIDEAQYIKNPMTQNARAVKAVKAAAKFALTGTPVENRLSELWSIFDYLMPGFLYSYQRFRDRFEIPIVRDEDAEALDILRRMAGPFILRRLKRDVLKDLPEKLEHVVYSRMEGDQRQLYAARASMLKETLEGGADENKIQILSALTRLRQICCDPRLVYDDYRGGSAKLETCMELIASAMENGYHILLFSQFTSMLELIRLRLKKAGIGYLILTGETSKEDRQNFVGAFQRGEAPVFLISLKAGGTGLNLTRADMVIHYDPWWNVAAQNQATDRAHRIGQEKTVTVIQLITKDTIEENILKLQRAKADLAGRVVTEENISLGSLSNEEIARLLE